MLETSTKAKRAAIGKQLVKLFTDAGWTPTFEEHGREACFIATGPAGHAVSIFLDNIPGLNSFLAHWHTSYREDGPRARYPESFPDDVNPYHRMKATTCEPTFQAFIAQLRQCLLALA